MVRNNINAGRAPERNPSGRLKVYTLRYLVRRSSLYLLTLFVAITVNFVIPRLIPGNPIEAKLAAIDRSPQIEKILEEAQSKDA